MRLESPRFVLYATGDEQRARNDIIALERYHAVLANLVPRAKRNEAKLTIFTAANTGDLQRTSPGIGSDVAGFYDTSIEQVKVVTAPFRTFESQGTLRKNVRAMDARVVLFHEYAHHFVQANLQVAYPRWYSEGLAEFVSTADFTDDGVMIGKFTQNRGAWLADGASLPIRKFIAPDNLSDVEIAMFYAQAWLATHYLFTNPERAKGFDRYVSALAGGAGPLEAFEPAFGITIDQFDTELLKYKQKPIGIFKMADPSKDYASGIQVARLSAAADELLLPMSYLRSVPLKAEANGPAAFVRSEAAKYPDDPFAQQSLATVDLWYGEPDKARALLDALVAARPNDPEILHLSGLCDLRQAYRTTDAELFRRARKQFAEAHRLDSTRGHSLFRYVECLTKLEAGFNQHMMDVSLEAYRLAPQTLVIRLLTAQALMQHKRWQEAQLVLRPMMMAAHGADKSNRVQQLMDAVKTETALPIVIYGAANTMELQPE